MSNEIKINNAEPFGLMFFEKFKTKELDGSVKTSVAPKSSGVTSNLTGTSGPDVDASVDVDFADKPCSDKPRLGF